MVKVKNLFSLVLKRPTFNHSNHQHPLEMTNFCEEDTLCAGCNIYIVAGKNYYTCKTCDFSLHPLCYNLPTTVHHNADPGHDLNLRLMGSFECRACGLLGHGFSYNCSDCDVYYHTECILTTTLTKKHALHRHKLTLKFSPPGGYATAFQCSVCRTNAYDYWLYRCDKCELDFHLSCVTTSEPKAAQTQYRKNSGTHGRQVRGRPVNGSNSASSSTPESGSPTMVGNDIGDANPASSTSPSNNPSTNNDPNPNPAVVPDQPAGVGSAQEGSGSEKKEDLKTSFLKGFFEGVGQEAARGVSNGLQAMVKKITGNGKK